MFGEIVDGVEFGRAQSDDTVRAGPRRSTSAKTGRELPAGRARAAACARCGRSSTRGTRRARRSTGARTSIPDDIGTAVNVVQMVFGNKGETSATGVALHAQPVDGRAGLYGEFLANAQGEDVVAGIRTPQPVEAMAQRLPEAYEQLLETMRRLEEHYRDMQDIEFTVEDDKLYLLQTRSAKRTAAASLKAAVDMVDEGLITREEAVARIDPAQLDQLLHPMIDPTAESRSRARAERAPGAASGGIVFDADTAVERGKGGEAVILVRWETTPDDIHGMIPSQGILTAHGGMTSHAAVVARGMGKPCVAGCEGLEIDVDAKTVTTRRPRAARGRRDHDRRRHRPRDHRRGAARPAAINEDFETILGWADEMRRLQVRANADTPRGRREGARVRRGGDRPLPHRAHVLRRGAAAGRAGDDPRRRRGRPPRGARPAAAVPAVRLRGDLRGDGRAAGDDPPARPAAARVPAAARGGDRRAMRAAIRALQETNPMLGTRGCRLGLQWPEIYEMQVRAIARGREARVPDAPLVEIMHPLVGFAEELRRLRELTEQVMAEEAPEIAYTCGTMIELPRACDPRRRDRRATPTSSPSARTT